MEKEVKKATPKKSTPKSDAAKEKAEKLKVEKEKAEYSKKMRSMTLRRTLAKQFEKRAKRLVIEVNRGINKEFVDKYLDLMLEEQGKKKK